MYACMHACMYVCMYVCICMYVCACVYIYIYISLSLSLSYRAREHRQCKGLLRAPVRSETVRLLPAFVKAWQPGPSWVGHNSGFLTWIWKGRGSQSDCASFRGILLLSSLCKAIHRAFRPNIQHHFETTSSPLGGRPGGMVVFLDHMPCGHALFYAMARSSWPSLCGSLFLCLLFHSTGSRL